MSENDKVVAMIGGIVRDGKYTLVVNRGFVRGTWDLALYRDTLPVRVRAQVAGSLYAALCYLRERCECEGFGEDIDWGNTDGQGQTETDTDGDDPDPRMIQEEQKEKLWDEVSGGVPANSARLGMSHVSEARANEMEQQQQWSRTEMACVSEARAAELERIAGKANCDEPLKLVVSLKPWTLEDEFLFQALWQRMERLSGKGRVEP